MQQGSKLLERVEARKAAEAAIELLKESVAGDSDHYWRIIREYASEKSPDPALEKFKPFTDRQAESFGLEEMPYGEFKGWYIKDVPLERLDWYALGAEEFGVRLIRYLKNEKIADRVREALKDE